MSMRASFLRKLSSLCSTSENCPGLGAWKCVPVVMEWGFQTGSIETAGVHKKNQAGLATGLIRWRLISSEIKLIVSCG